MLIDSVGIFLELPLSLIKNIHGELFYYKDLDEKL